MSARSPIRFPKPVRPWEWIDNSVAARMRLSQVVGALTDTSLDDLARSDIENYYYGLLLRGPQGEAAHPRLVGSVTEGIEVLTARDLLPPNYFGPHSFVFSRFHLCDAHDPDCAGCRVWPDFRCDPCVRARRDAHRCPDCQGPSKPAETPTSLRDLVTFAVYEPQAVRAAEEIAKALHRTRTGVTPRVTWQFEVALREDYARVLPNSVTDWEVPVPSELLDLRVGMDDEDGGRVLLRAVPLPHVADRTPPGAFR